MSKHQAAQQLNLAQRQLSDFEQLIQEYQAASQAEPVDSELKSIRFGTAAVKAASEMTQGIRSTVELAIPMQPNDMSLLKQMGVGGPDGRSWGTPVTKTMVLWLD